MSGPLLEAVNVGLDYVDGPRAQTVVRDVSLVIRAGEFVGLMGPSGSGKSSLLFVLAGLRPPSRGEVRLFGEPWSRLVPRAAERRRRHLGLVFQDPFLISYLTLRENAAAQALDAEARARIDPLALDLGVREVLDDLPERVSTGERQRASVMRALVNSPAVVLADEPTAHLDRASGDQVVRRLAEVASEAALLVATHDPHVLERADRVLRLEDGRLSVDH
jgi:putative ABC transport system ATP-binding protein